MTNDPATNDPAGRRTAISGTNGVGQMVRYRKAAA